MRRMCYVFPSEIISTAIAARRFKRNKGRGVCAVFPSAYDRPRPPQHPRPPSVPPAHTLTTYSFYVKIYAIHSVLQLSWRSASWRDLLPRAVSRDSGSTACCIQPVRSVPSFPSCWPHSPPSIMTKTVINQRVVSATVSENEAAGIVFEWLTPSSREVGYR